MVPIYSITAWGALITADETKTLVLDVIRDCYEAYVIYNFVVLLIAYAGGERPLAYHLELQPRLSHIWPVSIWLSPMALGPSFINFIRASCVQFVFVKPSMSLFMLYAHFHGLFGSRGVMKVVSGLVDTVSVSVAMYGLILFYHAAHEVLKPHNPLPKFLSVKAVVFFSFWQGVVLKAMITVGLLTDVADMSADEVATGLQDIFICFEMFLAACVHLFVFSYKEYKGEIGDGSFNSDGMVSAKAPLLKNVRDVIDFRDVLSDAKDRLEGGTKYESELRDSEPLISTDDDPEAPPIRKEPPLGGWSPRGPVYRSS